MRRSLQRKRFLFWFLTLSLSFFFSILTAELILRAFFNDRLAFGRSQLDLGYRHDRDLGWMPVKNSEKTFQGSRVFQIRHNDRGFRDEDHDLSDGPRMVVLGDSFVWGFDVERSERFTEKLRAFIPDWKIYNLGVSGYGTDQEFLLLQKHFDYYDPDLVVLVFCSDNDEDDNSRNMRYGGYFKPYFEKQGGKLELRGVPVPKRARHFFDRHPRLAGSFLVRLLVKVSYKTVNPSLIQTENPTCEILEHVEDFVRKKGAYLVVALQEKHPGMERCLRENEIPHLDLGYPNEYPAHGNHWTPEGHSYVSGRIYDFLARRDFLK